MIVWHGIIMQRKIILCSFGMKLYSDFLKIVLDNVDILCIMVI